MRCTGRTLSGEYGGHISQSLFRRCAGFRTFYAQGQTGQQLLLGAYSALSRQIGVGQVKMHTRHEMLDLVVVNGHARSIVTRRLITGEITSHAADTVVLATGGYGNVFTLSTNAISSPRDGKLSSL